MAYTLAVAAVGGGYGVMTAYTTSQPWSGVAPGVIAFDSAEAAGLGQMRAFVLDLRRELTTSDQAYEPFVRRDRARPGDDCRQIAVQHRGAIDSRMNSAIMPPCSHGSIGT